MNVDDRKQLMAMYEKMYQSMIDKDTDTFSGILGEEFVLHHMTGMVQTKKEYLRAIEQGTLNYFSAEHRHINIQIMQDEAVIIGDSLVIAAVFGGGKSTWRLRQTISCKKETGAWLMVKSVASMY